MAMASSNPALALARLVGCSARGNADRDSRLRGMENLRSGTASVCLKGRAAGGGARVVATARISSSPPLRTAQTAEEPRGGRRSMSGAASRQQPPATSNSAQVGEDEDEVVEGRAGAGSETLSGDAAASESGAERESGGGAEASATESSSDDIGRALSELRKARAAIPTEESPSLAPEFWRGVAEETRLIEWPVFSRVLGTTGVVVAMILGSSVVLLTVNAFLSATSDYALNDPAFRSFAKTYLNLAF